MRTLALAVAVLLVAAGDAARILGVFPHTGRTHFLAFEPVLLELAKRGHELVVLSHFPQKRPPPGWTDISLEVGTQTQILTSFMQYLDKLPLRNQIL